MNRLYRAKNGMQAIVFNGILLYNGNKSLGEFMEIWEKFMVGVRRSARTRLLWRPCESPWLDKFDMWLLRGDMASVMGVVMKRIDLCEHAGEGALDDNEFVFKVASRLGSGYLLGHASLRLRTDRDFILKLVRHNPLAVKYSADWIRDDAKIMLEVIAATSLIGATSSVVFTFASDRLKNNKLFIAESLRICGWTLSGMGNEVIDLVAEYGVKEAIERLMEEEWADRSMTARAELGKRLLARSQVSSRLLKV